MNAYLQDVACALLGSVLAFKVPGSILVFSLLGVTVGEHSELKQILYVQEVVTRFI